MSRKKRPPDSSTAHQRQTAQVMTMGSTRMSTATRLRSYTAVRRPFTQPGETKNASSCAGCCGRKSGGHQPSLRRMVRVRQLRPTSPSSYQSPSTAEPPRGGFQGLEDPTAILRPSEDARPLLIESPLPALAFGQSFVRDTGLKTGWYEARYVPR